MWNIKNFLWFLMLQRTLMGIWVDFDPFFNSHPHVYLFVHFFLLLLCSTQQRITLWKIQMHFLSSSRVFFYFSFKLTSCLSLGIGNDENKILSFFLSRLHRMRAKLEQWMDLNWLNFHKRNERWTQKRNVLHFICFELRLGDSLLVVQLLSISFDYDYGNFRC